MNSEQPIKRVEAQRLNISKTLAETPSKDGQFETLQQLARAKSYRIEVIELPAKHTLCICMYECPVKHGPLLTCAHYASLGPCTVTDDAVDRCQVVSLHRSRQHSSADLCATKGEMAYIHTCV